MKKEYDFSKGNRGVVVSEAGKTRITMYLDDSILEEFRNRADAAGKGYQTLINERYGNIWAVRKSRWMKKH